jgi:hypothetical protein
MFGEAQQILKIELSHFTFMKRENVGGDFNKVFIFENGLYINHS